MTAKYLLLCLLAFGWLQGCAQKKPNNPPSPPMEGVTADAFYDYLETAITGEWISKKFTIQVKSFQKTDTSFMVEVNEDNWLQKLNVLPYITYIKPDGTYYAEHRDRFDNLLYRPEGYWMVDGDSLHMIQKDTKAKFSYKLFIDDNRMELTSVIDYDDDGVVDDKYWGLMIKQE